MWLVQRLVDPAGAGERGWAWWSAEPVAVLFVGVAEDQGAGGVHLPGLAAVHDVRREQAEAGVAVMMVVGAKNSAQNARASARLANVPGKLGQYFRVLNWLSLYGLSLLTRGGCGSW